MTRLSHQWVFFFPDGSGIFQDDNAKIHQALVVKGWSMRTHECQGAGGLIFTHEFGLHRVLTLTPLKVFGMRWKRLKEWFDSPVINTKSWPKLNATLNVKCYCIRLWKQTPQQMRSVIKAKGGPTESVRLFFWTGRVFYAVSAGSLLIRSLERLESSFIIVPIMCPRVTLLQHESILIKVWSISIT